MPNMPGAPLFGFSLQPDGEGKPNQFVGIHIDAPFVSVIVGIPIGSVDAFLEDFATNIRALIDGMQKQSQLVVATDATMSVLKKGHQ